MTTGTRTRRPPRRISGDDREREILATAERLLAERSVHDISVDDLARGAGISRPTFYFYFPSKEAVVLTLLDRVVDEARTRRGSATDLLERGRVEGWREALTVVYDTFRAHRAVTNAAGQLITSNDEVRRLWARVMGDFADETTEAIEFERARGKAPDGLPARELAVSLNWMNERVFSAIFAGQEPTIDEDRAIDILLPIWLRAIYLTDTPEG